KIALPDLTSQNPQTPEPKPDTKIIHPPTCPVPWPDAISITPNGTRMMAERIRTPPASIIANPRSATDEVVGVDGMCHLTFDMRGGRQLAKPDVARPLDGRVRFLAHTEHRQAKLR